jgi:hypothetical protein
MKRLKVVGGFDIQCCTGQAWDTWIALPFKAGENRNITQRLLAKNI